MGLTCTCPEEAEGDGTWYYLPEDYSILATKKSRRCFSCHTKIKPGELCVAFPRARAPTHWIDRSCHGDEVPMVPWHLCEGCADIYFNLVELGYCIKLGDSMQDLLDEYKQIHADRYK